MERKRKGVSKPVLAFVLIVVIVVAVLGVYLTLTYPRTIVSFPVSFTMGAEIEHREFSVPILHDWLQVEVAVGSGTLLWTAKILSQDDVL